MSRVIDAHFHWYPAPLFERLCEDTGFPRADRRGASSGGGYGLRYSEGRLSLELAPVWQDLETGLEASRRASGDDTAVVGTTGVLGGILDQLDDEAAFKTATLYNEQLAAAQRQHAGSFYGTAYVPLRRVDLALEVLDRAVGELGLVGVNLPAVTGEETVDSVRLEPFYARAEELGVPLVVHPTDVLYGESFEGYDGAIFMTIGRLLDSSLTVLRLVFSGVLERHPRLKILHTHAGGLLPYQAGRIDKNGARRAGLPQPPSAYLQRLFVDTVAPSALTLRTAVEFYGASNVLYGTDYPCWDPEQATSVLEEGGLSPAERERVLGVNAAELFGIA